MPDAVVPHAAESGGFAPVRAESRPELLAPGTPGHQIFAEPLIALYALPGFLLPLMHPATAAATASSDKVFVDPNADLVDFACRLRDTVEMISGVAHAGTEADHVAYAMRELHRPMKGEDTLGATYHAWTRDIWTWNWAAIVAGYMHGYGQFRGWPSASFRQDAYLGMVEAGRRFGVLGMPATYEDFLAEWPTHRDRDADPRNVGVLALLALLTPSGLPRPRGFRWLPLPLWAVLSLPIRHFLRVAIIGGLTDDERRMIGFPARRLDGLRVGVHVAVWRCVPRGMTYRFGLLWMAGRARWTKPVWRTRFSAETLAARKA